jgi:hypothetical protein
VEIRGGCSVLATTSSITLVFSELQVTGLPAGYTPFVVQRGPAVRE